MNRLQEKQDVLHVSIQKKGFVYHLGEGITLVGILFMFGAGQVIWPDEEMPTLVRLFLFVVLAYFAYRMAIGVWGKSEK